MIAKTVCIGRTAQLSLRLSQLVVAMRDGDDGSGAKTERTIPIEDIGVLVLDSPHITITNAVLSRLVAEGVAVVTCDDKSMPAGMQLSLEGNNTFSQRFQDQLEASAPLRKQLWAQIVSAKITNQANVLASVTGKTSPMMMRMAADVRSGDPDNYEGHAAAHYWRRLFVDRPDFVRRREGPSPNNMLNYAYALLRSVVARALVQTGLLPVCGLHHHNKYNAYCLADDVMEPYRPFVDRQVLRTISQYGYADELHKDIKQSLLVIPAMDVWMPGERGVLKRSPLMVAAALTASSLAKCYAGTQRKLVLPQFDVRPELPF